MGCDCHGYIDYCGEHAYKDEKFPYVSNFAKLQLGRDYTLFAILAGVRNYDDIIPVSKLKGLPEHRSYRVNNDVSLYVVDDGEDCSFDERLCSRSNAKKWIESGNSIWLEQDKLITSPDNHSISWLSTEEVEKAIVQYKEHEKCNNIELIGILASMKAMEEEGVVCRFVFWFDN